MKIVEVESHDKDFMYFCQALQDYQFNLLPEIEQTGYSLTDDLDEIIASYVLYVNNKPIGSIGLKKLDDDTCEIVRVFICDDFRGQGLSKLLFQKVEQKAKQMGFSKAYIIAWTAAQAAVALYKKLNYPVINQGISEICRKYSYIEFLKDL